MIFVLIFLFWTVPTLVYLVLPYGGPPESEHVAILAFTNVLMYLGALFGALATQRRVIPRHFAFRGAKFDSVFIFFLIVALLINLYIYVKVNFALALINIAVRQDVYASAGFLWSALIIAMTISALLAGVARRTGRTISPSAKVLLLLNFIAFIGYGMKGNFLQFVVCYTVGYMKSRAVPRSGHPLFTRERMFKGFVLASAVLLGFWSINSVRAGSLYSVSEFFELIYFYMVPGITNFFNSLQSQYNYPYPLGGLLGGFYKMFGATSPLAQVDQGYLESTTWNVWSYLTSLYASGGFFELYFGSFVIGLYVAMSVRWFFRADGLVSRMNFAQMIMLLVMLHNSYYFESFAPLFSVFVTCLIGKYIAVGRMGQPYDDRNRRVLNRLRVDQVRN